MKSIFQNPIIAGILPLLLALLCFLHLPCCSSPGGSVVVIGSKLDTEGAIMGYIQLLALQAAGIPVEDRIETGPTLITRQALRYGELDGYIEYTGTALVNFMHVSDPAILADADSAYQTVRAWDEREHQIVWLQPWSGINNTYTLMMRRPAAEALGIESISQLGEYLAGGGELRLGSDPEFAARADGLPGLLERYGVAGSRQLEVLQMDAGLVYQTLQQGNIDAAIGYSTDGRIAAFNLLRLRDDLHYFPVYNPTPTYRAATLQQFPQIRTILDRIAATITADEITAMNYRHDVEHARAKSLAREWLDQHDLMR